ncbi:hypothetical protein CTAYLR_000920 [Chrysophaeum taylorii]|uniref:Alpha/beta hydrolase fold-5 domain-containing protein n=1 Tax=Chrysophaeum taylorii TaxID=2483200 RepID=A0AAD7UFY5_9STRA|nr:hypothetical protein CTAYLR_000920 [Chrysophaeum taylorii]
MYADSILRSVTQGLMAFSFASVAWYVAAGISSLGALYLLFVVLVVIFQRQPAFESAREVVKKGYKGVAISETAWGLSFVPPKESKIGIVYFPGALVDHVAYAPLCARIAARAKAPVFLISVPLRLATLSPRSCASRARDAKRTTNAAHWIYAGHSLGGSAAKAAASKDDQAVGLLLHASYCDARDVPDRVRILQVVAEADKIVTDVCEPDGTRVAVSTVKGGNHAGFAHYGPQTFPRRDGERTTTLDAQIRQAADASAEWATNLLGGGD